MKILKVQVLKKGILEVLENVFKTNKTITGEKPVIVLFNKFNYGFI